MGITVCVLGVVQPNPRVQSMVHDPIHGLDWIGLILIDLDWIISYQNVLDPDKLRMIWIFKTILFFPKISLKFSCKCLNL